MVALAVLIAIGGGCPGRKLAVANTLGVWVIDLRSPARGAELVTAFGTPETGLGMFGTARPTWGAAP